MQTPEFKISIEGTSRTIILSQASASGYTPIARFYHGRTDQALLDRIAAKLNA